MQCEKFEDRLFELLDQRRTPRADATLLAHARRCPLCQKLLGQMDLLLEGLSQRELPTPPDDLADRVLSALNQPPAIERPWANYFVPLAIAATVLVAAAISLWQWTRPPRLQPEGPTAIARSAAGAIEWYIFRDSPEMYLQMFHYTGRAMATLPDAVRRATIAPTAPDDGLITTSFRPVANSVYVAVGTLLDTLPGKPLNPS